MNKKRKYETLEVIACTVAGYGLTTVLITYLSN